MSQRLFSAYVFAPFFSFDHTTLIATLVLIRVGDESWVGSGQVEVACVQGGSRPREGDRQEVEIVRRES
jgi:hypothetical protein